MRRLTAFVSGKVQKTGYRARVVDLARALGLKGYVMNLDDGRVKIIAEGEDDRLKWFEEAIDIKNTLIQVSSIEREHSEVRGDFPKFYKTVESDETDSRLDTAAVQLTRLIDAVNNMNNNLGCKLDMVIQKQDQTLDLQEKALNKQEHMLDLQHDLLDEVRESRKDLKGYLGERFGKLEDEVAEIRTALRAKGII